MELMNIKYSAHAVDRMLQRKITTTQIERILNDPDGMIHQSIDKIIFYHINFDTYNILNLMKH